MTRGGTPEFCPGGINSGAAWENESGLTEAFGDGYFFRRSVNFVDTSVKRGDIYYADLSPVVGSEQGGIRPVLIIQNDVGNRHSPTVICAAITSKMNKAKLPTHIEIDASAYGIEKDSVILLEQLRTIDKRRLKDKVCHLDSAMLDKVNHALEISLELTF